MKLYLALDTATDVAGVAVGTASNTAAEIVIADRRHGTALAPAIQNALELAGVTMDDLSGVVLADGPGSFTGLRIGVATAKGLIQSHDHLTLAVVPSLLGLAWSAHGFGWRTVAAAYDALRGDLFAAVYRFAGGVETVVAPMLTTPEDLERVGVRPDVVLGEGALKHADWATNWSGRPPAGPPLVTPRAASLLQLCALDGAVREIGDITGFEPNYGRLAEAQVRWEDTHGRPLPDSESRTR